MFGFTVIAVLSALLFGSTECAITGWTAGGGTTATQDVTDTSCASVAEDGTVSFTVTATTGATSITGYAIQTQPTGTTGTYMFAVTSVGVVTLASGQLDREADSSMVVVIRATDDAGTPATGDLTCTLTVTDVTEGPPGFSLLTNCLSFANNLPATTSITTVAGSLAYQTVTLALTEGNTGNMFTYTPASGALDVGSSPLTTSTATYALKFTATDNASPAQTGSTTVTVMIGTACPCSSAVVMTISAYLFLATLLAFLG